MGSTLRLHGIVDSSLANGPGARIVVWFQGCTLGCPHCFNPATHRTDIGHVVSVDEVWRRVHSVAADKQGVTITGGEPMQQAASLASLLKRLRETTPLSIILFSGFSMAELERHRHWPAVAAHLDVVIAGRYQHDRRVASGLLGSANKTVYFLTDRYAPNDLARVPPAEVIVAPDGEVTITGIDPPAW